MTAKEILKNQRVLLVDDDQSIRLSLSYFFRNKVGSFTAQETAELALDHLQKEACDIVLCDYRLPGMNGLAFFQELERLDLPVLKVLITAYGDMELAINAIKTGIHDFILKPFNARTVEQSLINLLEKTPKQTPAVQVDGETLEDIQQHLKAKHEAVLRKITHKMNNILQAMVGNADMGLLELGNSSQLTKRFDNIIGGIDEIRNITKVMTNIYEPGKLIIETTHVTDLVDKIILKYSNVMQMDGIKLSKCYGSDINVITYTEYLYDIIEAIIVNAIQGLGQNDKDARILNIYINKEGSNVKIKIISNSSGIVPDILGKVTIGELTAKPFKNGLEKHIVNILGLVIGATINTKSEPGKDTNVEITIPLVLPSVALGKERQKLNRQLNKL